MAGSDIPAELSALDKALTSIEAVVDPDAKKAEIAKLSDDVAAPDLWGNPEHAQRI
ncbi:MAG: peptide chain release factor 2, partial [Microlunatus sp.]|nr:peptide chain release factor 2 [Microlunatus sp.]